ncbi:helix-turn-helix domain-containing protein [Streptococcus pantholopis]|uniref:Transcriptional regulator n=1 Tax=Streptococcus pantholopis TaxID=1811193 RepID=A0A172Q9E6_9STRE|nr:helix-turn-helix transcriptional regulator [Streptococcus pantholopis]AND80109.1 transcriptional regulator [Streptococcus pantholopis]
MEEIKIKLDEIIKSRKLTSKELAKRINITEANLSILKTGKAKGIRFSTLLNICRELNCQPGDILKYIRRRDDEP